MKSIFIFTAVSMFCAVQATAKCPSSPPKTSIYSSAEKSGDKTVDAKWLKANLVGRKVDFGRAGSENYFADGRYVYLTRDAKYTPNGYKFYSNGMRCLDYAQGPRFDKYVVNNGSLVLINGKSERAVAKLKKLK